MDNLHVDSELTATVRDDKDADRATARLESSLQTRPEVALLNDGEVLLDIASLGHGDDGTVLDVEDTVLLEDRAEHALDDNGGRRVRDGAGLLVELLGKEVDTEVPVLAGGGRGGDADDLAGTTLEDQDVAQADVVAGDGDGGGSSLVSSGANTAAGAGRGADLGVLDMAGSLVVVVTHLGCVVVVLVGRLAGDLDSLVDDGYVLAIGTNRGRDVDGGLVNDGRGLLKRGGRVAGGVNCLVDTNSLLVGGWAAAGCSVNGVGDFFLVVGLETRAIFTLG
jgi:hypothetical protein